MGDADDLYAQRIRQELSRPGVARALLKFAASWRRSPHDAEDVVHNAVARVLELEGPRWDPAGTTTFLEHMAVVIARVAANEKRAWTARNVKVDGAAAMDEEAIDPGALPDHALDTARTHSWVTKVRDEILGELDRSDSVAAAVYRAILKGQGAHSEIAKEAGCKLGDVRLAHERIQRRIDTVVERDQAAERARLRARRVATSNLAMKGAVP